MQSNLQRETSAEARAKEHMMEQDLQDLRQAAEVHRQTRAYVMSWIKPGMKMIDICERLENKNRQLIDEAGLERGLAFPTGSLSTTSLLTSPPTPATTPSLACVGYIALTSSHSTASIQADDVCKIDFGTHVNGVISR